MTKSVDELIEILNGKFYRMPSGLTRIERRMYFKFIASVEGFK